MTCPRCELLDSRYDNGLWQVIDAPQPYPLASHHLHLVPDLHAADPLDLTPKMHAAFWDAADWCRDTYAPPGYGLALRTDPAHCYAEFVIGDQDKMIDPCTGVPRNLYVEFR